MTTLRRLARMGLAEIVTRSRQEASKRIAGEAVRDWLKTGQNELNALMRGEHETGQLADKVLCYLAERLGAGTRLPRSLRL